MAKDYYEEKNGMKKQVGSWAYFGPFLVLLLCAIILILFKFSVNSLNESKKDIINQITGNSIIRMQRAEQDLTKIMVSSSVASGMLSDDGVDYEHWRENVSYLIDEVNNIYMVSITDTNGNGVCSHNQEQTDLKVYYKDDADFVFTSSDGVTGKSAIVSVVPIKAQGEIFGYINCFIDQNALGRTFSLEGNDASNSFLLIEQNGNIAFKNGNISKSLGDNFYTFLEGTISDGSPLDGIRSDIIGRKIINVSIKVDNKEYMIISTPMSMNNWTGVQIIDKGYYNNLVKEKYEDERNLVMQLTVLFVIAIIFIGVVLGVSKAKDKEVNKNLEDKADTDLLTGLTNKIATERKIKETLERETDTQHLLLLFDIDNFKKINDTMGHAFGDQVLQTLGEQLRQEFRKTDILGRTGGDEFTLLLKDLRTDDIVKKECDKIITFFNQFKVGDYVKYSATASIGAAVFAKDGVTFEELYSAADKALYEAKKQGKNRLVYANSELAEYAKVANKVAEEQAETEK